MDFDRIPAGHRPLPDLSERPLSQQAFFGFMRAVQLHRQLMTRQMLEHGIHPSQSFALREIAHCDGITQRDLADKLNISRPTLTVTLQKMEKARLVERRADERDQRYTRLYLTTEGHAAHERMRDTLGEMVARTTGALSEHDQREFARLIGAINDSLSAALGGDETPCRPSRPAEEL